MKKLIVVSVVVAGVIVFWFSTAQTTKTAPNTSKAPSAQNRTPEQPTQLSPAQVATSAVAESTTQPDQHHYQTVPASDMVSVQLHVGDKTLTPQGSDGIIERTDVPLDEAVELDLSVPAAQKGEKVEVFAPHGGSIERLDGPLPFIAKSETEKLRIRFKPTLGRGDYSIDIRHAGRTTTIKLWAGDPLRMGAPGPQRVANNEPPMADDPSAGP